MRPTVMYVVDCSSSTVRRPALTAHEVAIIFVGLTSIGNLDFSTTFKRGPWTSGIAPMSAIDRPSTTGQRS